MHHDESRPCSCDASQDGVSRRAVLLGTGLAALSLAGKAQADGEIDPNAALPPQAGDVLIQANGMQMGQPVTAASFTTPDTLIQAWPKDPKTGVLRNKSRLNRVLLIKMDPAVLDTTTRQRSADGVIAYSDFCTHAGCFIETFHPQDSQILCHCHGSVFDPRNDARVVGGPAKGPLAGLPLKIVDAQLVVAGAFAGKLGVAKPA